jgi:ATP-binding cassette subfamily F protein 3
VTPYTGDYAAFVAQYAERRLTQQRAADKQRRVVDKEQDYIRRNIAGQNSKQAKGRRKRLDRLPRLSAPPGADDTMAVAFDVRERGGDQVLETRGTHRLERQWQVDDVGDDRGPPVRDRG